MRQATTVSRDDLVALGTCFGKFTKTKKFHLKITALDHLAQYAKVRTARQATQGYPLIPRGIQEPLAFGCVQLRRSVNAECLENSMNSTSS